MKLLRSIAEKDQVDTVDVKKKVSRRRDALLIDALVTKRGKAATSPEDLLRQYYREHQKAFNVPERRDGLLYSLPPKASASTLSAWNELKSVLRTQAPPESHTLAANHIAVRSLGYGAKTSAVHARLFEIQPRAFFETPQEAKKQTLLYLVAIRPAYQKTFTEARPEILQALQPQLQQQILADLVKEARQINSAP